MLPLLCGHQQLQASTNELPQCAAVHCSSESIETLCEIGAKFISYRNLLDRPPLADDFVRRKCAQSFKLLELQT